MQQTAKDTDRIAVYTVIIGRYDILRRPKYVDENCDYYCLTDERNLSDDFWQIIPLTNPEGLDPSRLSRQPKILPHQFFPAYSKSLYIDPNLEIRKSVNEYITRYSTGRSMLCMKHSERDCIYEEAEACIRLSKDDPKKIEEQMAVFRAAGYPSHNGLTQNSVLYRVHDDAQVIAVMNDWWHILKTGSRRDQLSLCYVCWKHRFSYDTAEEHWLNCAYFQRYAHLSEAGFYRDTPVGKVVFRPTGDRLPEVCVPAAAPLLSTVQNYLLYDKRIPLPMAYRFEGDFLCPADAKTARYFPLEGCRCVVSDFTAYLGRTALPVRPVNGYEAGPYLYFPHAGAQIDIDLPPAAHGQLHLSATIHAVHHAEDWALISAASSTKDIQDGQLRQLQEQLHSISNSTIWRLTRPLRQTLDRVKHFTRSRPLARLKELARSRRAFAQWFVSRRFSRRLPDRLYIRLLYRAHMDEKLDLKNPRSYNQKLQWLKLFDRNPLYCKLSDKYAVREFVSQKAGEAYLVPLLGVYPTFEEIDFSKLPHQFVLKTTHDSGGVVICDDIGKFDSHAAGEKLNAHLKKNYYEWGREWNYKNIPPQIIAEAYLTASGQDGLRDYKFMCFDGRVKCCLVGSGRHGAGLTLTFFDPEWNLLPFERHYPRSVEPIPKPRRFDKMMRLAETLSEGIPFVRVDLYETDDAVYFGEMTFYPACGLSAFVPAEWDVKLGEWINLRRHHRCAKGGLR